jgi:hypothetical protein
VYGYNNKESIDRDIVISRPGESDIDNDDLCDVLLNFIAKVADLLHY